LIVSKDKIAANGEYNITGERYRETERREKQKWKMVKLGDIVLFIGGYAFKSSDMKESQISTNFRAVVKIGNVGKNGILDMDDIQFHEYSENLRRFNLCVGDVVIAMTGATVGKVAFVDKPNLLLNQRVGALRVKEIVLQNYIFNLLHTSVFYEFCQQKAGGGAQSNISPEDILAYQIPLPPIEIQQEIVAEIEGYQKIIDGARQVVDNWKPYIDIDLDWQTVKLGDVCEINPKKSEVSTLPPETKVSFVPMADIQEHRISFQCKEQKDLSEVGSSYTYFRDNDVLLAKVTPCFENGKAGIAKDMCNGIGFGSSEFYVLRSNKETIPEWIYYCIMLPFFREGAIAQMTGTGGLQRVPRSYVENFFIPLPPLETQRAIVEKIEAEQNAVDGCRELVTLYEEKIKAVIEKVWGEDTKKA